MQAEERAASRADMHLFGELRVVQPRIVVAALMLVTAGAGALHLGYRGLSLDESVSLRRAGESWSHLIRTVTGEDPNMSIYYILLKIWSGAFGDGVLAARSLSIMFAVLAVPVVYALGAQLFDRRAGLAAATLLALNAYFLRYAQEARAYSMVALLVTVSSYAFVLSVTRPRPSFKAVYVASSALAFYAHYYAAWVILAQLIVLIATRRRLIDRAWMVTYGAIGVLVLPMAYWALTLDHNPIGWLKQPGWRYLWDSSAQLSGDSFRQVGGVLAVCLLVLPWAARSPRLRWGLLFTALWVVVPIVGAFSVSQFHPILDAKYLLVCVPGLMLLTAGAVTSLRPLAAAAAVFLVLVVMNGPPLRAWYRWHGEPDWQGLTAYVEADIQPRDGLVINGPSARSEFERFSPDSFARTTDASLDRFGPRRVWVVRGYGAQATAAQQGRLRRAYVLVKQRSFEGATAELYTRK